NADVGVQGALKWILAEAPNGGAEAKGKRGRVRHASARSKFYVRDPPDDNKANWLKVGLTLGTTVFLWFYLIKEHHEDVLEYKRRNGLE
ncbi:NADH dehydrogenase [ubiquinone] 1 subunit C1, mitochondrial, partial [Fukomys damarensis]|uniref:NADH dehydrogenase [ubiquinone] 1 subunit C1, mitochondrial n=1 Tax=Fukomys damarensis TaxID=885580 RepID=UPI00145576F4